MLVTSSGKSMIAADSLAYPKLLQARWVAAADHQLEQPGMSAAQVLLRHKSRHAVLVSGTGQECLTLLPSVPVMFSVT